MRVAALTAYEGTTVTALPEGFIQHLQQTFGQLLSTPKDQISTIPLAAPMPQSQIVFSTDLETAPRTEGIEGPEIVIPVGLALLEHRRKMTDATYRAAIAEEKSRYEGLGPGARQKKYNQLIVLARAKAAHEAGISVADLRDDEKRPEILKKLCPWAKQFQIHEKLIYPRILEVAGITLDELISANGAELETMKTQITRARSAVEDEIRRAVVRFESRRYETGLSQTQIERRPELKERASSARNKKK